MPGMPPAPQLLNRPPQIFGSYAPDGMPVLPPELAAQMAFDPSTLLDDANEAKRRRIARVSVAVLSAQPKLCSWALPAGYPC
jgi:hypothetical protein